MCDDGGIQWYQEVGIQQEYEEWSKEYDRQTERDRNDSWEGLPDGSLPSPTVPGEISGLDTNDGGATS